MPSVSRGGEEEKQQAGCWRIPEGCRLSAPRDWHWGAPWGSYAGTLFLTLPEAAS